MGNIRAYGDIIGDNETNISSINNITTLGDITSYGNIIGDSNTNISNIDTITATNGLFTSVPTSDPYTVGKLWNSDGDCKISQGNLLTLSITSSVNIVALTIGGVRFYINGDGVAQTYKWKGFSPSALAITSSVSTGYTYTFSSLSNGASVTTTSWDGSTSNAITCRTGSTLGVLSIVAAAPATGYIKFRWNNIHGVGTTTGTMPSGVSPVRTMSPSYQSFGTGSYPIGTYQFRLENDGDY